ncbi:hypothetical protein QJS10_CPB04g00903 [Acorus calamus]|uniref:Uncharacterized protein n=1 Tax=Acorus calamus TaxID=4465 RepID=A0AAV9F0P9_ACOCL|nr:hypothetical protein QJS10_CPB04g00903 [Acorus calamus]
MVPFSEAPLDGRAGKGSMFDGLMESDEGEAAEEEVVASKVQGTTVDGKIVEEAGADGVEEIDVGGGISGGAGDGPEAGKASPVKTASLEGQPPLTPEPPS